MKHLQRRILTTAAAFLCTVAAVSVATAEPASAIVGGRDATRLIPGVATVQVLFPGVGTALCGGSLITNEFVLTAAHCVSDDAKAPAAVAMPAANVTVRLHSLDRTAGGIVVTGQEVFLPPGWAWASNWPTSAVSDYALIKLAHPVDVPTTPLDRRLAPVNGPVQLVGWGLTEFPPTAGPPTILQQRDTTRLADSACAGGFIGAGEICLGNGACYGDSGSPALTRDGRAATTFGRTWGEVGLASRETDENQPCNAPTVYTDTSYHPMQMWVWTTVLTRRHLPCTCPPAAAHDPNVNGRVRALIATTRNTIR